MLLETERLKLIPLKEKELDLWLNNLEELEKNINISYKAEPMEGFFKEIVKGQLEITKKDPDNYIWHSFWLIIEKRSRIVIGAADFKDVPDDNGEVEIGYGLGKEFEHKGYMTEAVKAMCEFGKKQEGVKHIIAETELDNIPSHNILKRCGFKEYSRDETIWWRC